GGHGRRGEAATRHGRGVERLAARAPRPPSGRVAGLATHARRAGVLLRGVRAGGPAVRLGRLDRQAGRRGPHDDVVRAPPQGQRVDPHQQGPGRPARAGRADGAGRHGCGLPRQGDRDVDPDGPGRGPGRPRRPVGGVRAPPGRSPALGVVVALGAEGYPRLDRAGQAGRDACRPGRRDRREGCPRGEGGHV
ncbi:MAG: hypothetical protein AVDCRST_MAG32-2079, partial [uncultured Nocardioides sp.]